MKRVLVSIAALLAATTAHASITPTLVGGPVDVGNGTYRYTYNALLASDQALETGSYFTLYDVGGFVGFGNLGTGFSGTTQLLGLTPGNTIPNDSASMLNVSFIYSGPTFNFDGPTSERDLGNFEIFSTQLGTRFDDFTSEAMRNAGPTRGSLVATIGTNAVTVPGAVPEPAMWGMMIVGFGMVGLQMRGRKARGAAVSA
ncbi:PEPxxWA-CTERM sorting domain-containing protein [Polymorphobacter fuscus]|nr:PEPxxWA-CTERM sorting domain-containing protein [Polymorphobacter fuscus]NJC08354.1 hypothetical protein [Polymorphobacter fuscus]